MSTYYLVPSLSHGVATSRTSKPRVSITLSASIPPYLVAPAGSFGALETETSPQHFPTLFVFWPHQHLCANRPRTLPALHLRSDTETAKEKAEAIVDEDAVDEAESEECEDDKKKKAEKPKHLVKSRFIPLVDLLPPPPSKGTFLVEHIKESQYFFS
ncbi:hypothetical protein D9619_009016 [Psilocybe cf. subviscida]|uniref:DNA-directed RNA polymerase C-terminal domain-containing protein n=1 Tax=Psilocybe cf. subviscida TaxID=2480587 RepID=A0A8H5BU37_9AGAR|nr:hypothetical protein D9619_009016 [Psilocybe cf. subviscida]